LNSKASRIGRVLVCVLVRQLKGESELVLRFMRTEDFK
jgi:hypothetical protein